ncbi:MAG: pilin [bacterium]|nr:pilin [bacterium]
MPKIKMLKIKNFLLSVKSKILGLFRISDFGFRILRLRGEGMLFAAFAPLADVSQSGKLSSLYNSDQNLATYINTMFKVAISAGAIIAVIRLGIAGFKYMGGDMWHTKEKAKEDIREVFFGLFLLLSIWIILAQINPNLLNLNIVFPKTAAIAPPSTPSVPSYAPSVVPDEEGALNRILKDESSKRAILASAGIGINKGPCSQVFQTNCTDVGLLGASAITGLQQLKSACQSAQGNCPVTITGGTEWWLHSRNTTHGPNNSTVDLAKGRAMDTYIMNNGQHTYSYTFIKGQKTDVYTLNGGTYYSEDNAHWHVVF